MSKATKRKHVTKEVLDEFVVPDDMRQIVKVHTDYPLESLSYHACVYFLPISMANLCDDLDLVY